MRRRSSYKIHAMRVRSSYMECGRAARHERSYRFRRDGQHTLAQGASNAGADALSQAHNSTPTTRHSKAAAARAALHTRLTHAAAYESPASLRFGVRSRSEAQPVLRSSQSEGGSAATAFRRQGGTAYHEMLESGSYRRRIPNNITVVCLLQHLAAAWSDEPPSRCRQS